MKAEFSMASEEELPGVAAEWLDAHGAGGVFGLSGTLGAGKTAFVRAVVRELHFRAGTAAPRVPSPTYVYRTSYEIGRVPIEHFDLYRLDIASAGTLAELGYYEAVENVRAGKGFLFVEWPERAQEPADLDLTERWELTLAADGERRHFRRCDGPPSR